MLRTRRIVGSARTFTNGYTTVSRSHINTTTGWVDSTNLRRFEEGIARKVEKTVDERVRNFAYEFKKWNDIYYNNSEFYLEALQGGVIPHEVLKYLDEKHAYDGQGNGESRWFCDRK